MERSKMRNVDPEPPISGAKYIKTILAFLLCMAAIFANRPAWSQASSGTITGLVTDPKGDVIPGAQVTVISAAGNFTTQTRTSDEGAYEVPAIPPGSYLLKIHAP